MEQQPPALSFAQGPFWHVCVLATHTPPASPQFASLTHPTHVFEEGSQNVGLPPSGAQLASLVHATQRPVGLQASPEAQLPSTRHCTQRLLADSCRLKVVAGSVPAPSMARLRRSGTVCGAARCGYRR
jgi:hypothetical protein